MHRTEQCLVYKTGYVRELKYFTVLCGTEKGSTLQLNVECKHAISDTKPRIKWHNTLNFQVITGALRMVIFYAS